MGYFEDRGGLLTAASFNLSLSGEYKNTAATPLNPDWPPGGATNTTVMEALHTNYIS